MSLQDLVESGRSGVRLLVRLLFGETNGKVTFRAVDRFQIRLHPFVYSRVRTLKEVF